MTSRNIWYFLRTPPPIVTFFVTRALEISSQNPWDPHLPEVVTSFMIDPINKDELVHINDTHDKTAIFFMFLVLSRVHFSFTENSSKGLELMWPPFKKHCGTVIWSSLQFQRTITRYSQTCFATKLRCHVQFTHLLIGGQR